MPALLLSIALVAGVAGAPQGTSVDASFDRAATAREVQQVLDAFMEAFNRIDVAAWERTFHFPHYRLASGDMSVLEQPGQQDASELRRRLEASGWQHSAWERREIVHLSADKAHVDTRFVRYRADGSVLAAFDSLYVLTKEDGRWGVKLRSSFAP